MFTKSKVTKVTNHLENGVFMQEFFRKLLIYVLFYFMSVVRSFMNYAIFHELCDRMRSIVRNRTIT